MPILVKTADRTLRKKGATNTENVISAVETTKLERYYFTGDGVTTQFTTTFPIDVGNTHVYLNGVLLVLNVDYRWLDSQTIEFTYAPSNGDEIIIEAYGNFTVADTYTRGEIDSGIPILNAIKNVDGIGSGLDADLVRGLPADFTNSIGANGYQILPSGLIIQWGITTTGNVTYPITFPNAVLSIVASPGYPDGRDLSNSAQILIDNITTSSCVITAYDAGIGVTVTSNGVMWQAIGY